jgi:CRP-like cAMP-binding protein
MNANETPWPSRFSNKVLQALSADVIQRLSLKQIPLPVGRKIEFTGTSIDNVFFIESGVGSMTTQFEDGSQVEVGMFGFESVMGVSALMGTKRSLNRIYMQIAGHGYASPIERARAEFQRFGQFHDLALRYVQAQLTQATQSAGCNAKHSVEQRLARWLLLCADRLKDNAIPISQEFLADTIGSRRTTVTVAIGQLKARGIIDHRRTMIHITDRQALEQRACECYRIVQQHLNNYLEFDTGFMV